MSIAPTPRCEMLRVDHDDAPSLLERTLTATDVPRTVAHQMSGAWMGVCELPIDASTSRPLIHFTDGRGQSHRRRLDVLDGVVIEVSDEVLLIQPANRSEPLVVGTVNRQRKMNSSSTPATSLVLAEGQSIRITDATGTPLLEVSTDAEKSRLRCLQTDVCFEVAGKYSVEADEIELRARHGSLQLEAAQDDIVARGQYIRLN